MTQARAEALPGNAGRADNPTFGEIAPYIAPAGSDNFTFALPCDHLGQMVPVGGNIFDGNVQCYDNPVGSGGQMEPHHQLDAPGFLCKGCNAEYCESCTFEHIRSSGSIPPREV